MVSKTISEAPPHQGDPGPPSVGSWGNRYEAKMRPNHVRLHSMISPRLFGDMITDLTCFLITRSILLAVLSDFSKMKLSIRVVVSFSQIMKLPIRICGCIQGFYFHSQIHVSANEVSGASVGLSGALGWRSVPVALRASAGCARRPRASAGCARRPRAIVSFAVIVTLCLY